MQTLHPSLSCPPGAAVSALPLVQFRLLQLSMTILRLCLCLPFPSAAIDGLHFTPATCAFLSSRKTLVARSCGCCLQALSIHRDMSTPLMAAAIAKGQTATNDEDIKDQDPCIIMHNMPCSSPCRMPLCRGIAA